MTSPVPNPSLPSPTPRVADAPPPWAQRSVGLYASVLAAGDAQTAARRLVQTLAEDAGFLRASIALDTGRGLRLLATSGVETIDPHNELAQLLLGAMHEAIEQGATLVQPAGTHDARCIRIEHEALHRRVGGSVATVPLAVDGATIGAVTVQRGPGAPPGAGELQALEHLLALAAPALRWQVRASEPLYRTAWRRLGERAAGLRDPSRRRSRWLLGGVGGVLALLAILPLPHQIGGRARLEGFEQRVLAAPTDGFIKVAHARPGDRVAEGAVLVELMEHDLLLERERWASQLAQHENGYAAAMSRADRTQASVSVARIEEAQSQLALVNEQLTRSRLAAPFDGVVIEGDLSQSIGAPVRQGDALVTLAATGRYRVIVEVDEVDIGRIRVGQAGTLRLSALPWDTRALEVERIAPLAKATDGRNVFEVQARLTEPDVSLRPGLRGHAKVAVGRAPALWVWARPWLDRARLALWAW
jgi:biotin carboxyl carrier protein